MKSFRAASSLRMVLVLCLALLAGQAHAQEYDTFEGSAHEGDAHVDDARYSVLVFTKTAGFRHASIPEGVAALQELGRDHNFAVEHTEDASIFNPQDLGRFEAVVFLNTTGDILNTAQQEAFEEYIAHGRGFVGIHAAADTEYEWTWYGELVGAYFESHPPGTPTATITVEDRHHRSTEHLPERWERTDEWYNYRENPRGNVHVLMTLDQSTFEGSEMGEDHPIAWAHEFGGGRAWYTGLGHTEESYEEPFFLEHILGGIEWAVGEADSDAAAIAAGSFQKVVLVEETTNPMMLAIAPDDRVFFIERGGAIRVWHPDTGSTSLAGFIPVETTHEDGMLGITLDPNFMENGWMYLFYSPAGIEAKNVLARFTVAEDRIDPASKEIMLEVPTQREECCHTGGALVFGPDGNLFVSTGDDTNPFASDGFAPIDERPGREAWDAQRTSANTMDLRGKILRIRPQPDGTYTIPEGNLFPDGEEGRPEIYVMGLRNPYRMSVDQRTGWLYFGDVGPDAGATDPDRGPIGLDEFNQAREAGNYGWPYFLGDNQPYVDYDFELEESGEAFDPERPVNDSPNNTGARVLPPAQPSFIWYPYGMSEEFPELGVGGRTSYAGPVYDHDSETVHPRGLPAYFDGTLFIYEWMRNWIMEVKLDEGGEIREINPLFPEMIFVRPMDMQVGPDGRLYVIEWGEGFHGNNETAQIVRLDYYGSPERPPVAVAEAAPTTGALPLTVQFSAAKSHSPQEDALTYAWDLNGNGEIDATQPDVSHTYSEPGEYTARLTVTDSRGVSTTEEIDVVAGNTRPEVTITWPVAGGFFDYGEPIRYEVEVSDVEDGEVEGEEIVVRPYLGRDSHELPLQRQLGNEGSFVIYQDDEYEYWNNQVVVLEAKYTDEGAEGVGSLTGHDRIVLQPRRKGAEFFTTAEGAARQNLGDIRTKEDFRVVIEARDGASVSYAPVNLINIESMTFRVRPDAGGTIEVRQDEPDGPLLAEVDLGITAEAATGSDAVTNVTPHAEGVPGGPLEGWFDVTAPVTDPGETHTLYLVFRSEQGGTVGQVDWIQFNGRGISGEAGQPVR